MISTANQPEQLCLFETGVDMGKLRRMAKRITAHARASNTAMAYASDWRDFGNWCKRAGRATLPATPDTLTLYLTDLAQTKAMATLTRRICAISAEHQAAGLKTPYTADVKEFMCGCRRAYGRPQQGKAALSVDQLRRICTALVKLRTVNGVRDQAMLVLGFACGMRVSELVGLQIEDVTFQKKGLRVFIGKSKTDQEKKGREIGIFEGKRATTCPVRTLKKWLYVRGKSAGPLFTRSTHARASLDGIGATRFGYIMKECLTLIGEDPAPYGPHSLRAGCVTAAIQAGVPESLVMQRTGHKSMAVMARYVRPARLFQTDVLAGAL